MYQVGIYLKVRQRCLVDQISERQASKEFGISRNTVSKMVDTYHIQNRQDISVKHRLFKQFLILIKILLMKFYTHTISKCGFENQG